jgi:hypothetical protein
MQREMAESIDAASIEIGRAIIPMMTKAFSELAKAAQSIADNPEAAP